MIRLVPLLSISILMVVFASETSFAQYSPPNLCDAKPSHVEQSYCMALEQEKADKELNAAYKRAQTAIDHDSLSNDERRRSWKEALLKAQRAWIAFRDADCGELVAGEWHDGTGAGPAGQACVLDKTVKRTRELMERYDSENQNP